MNDKKASRLRRAAKVRARIREVGTDRISVHRTPRHIYAQIIRAGTAEVICSASTLDKQLRAEVANGGNKDAAVAVGTLLAERAKAAGITTVAFDRSGFRYHGRVKALADAARAGGLEF